MSDDIKPYLRDISRIPLLSQAQEQALAIAMHNAPKGSLVWLDKRNQLVDHNYRLVVSVAKKYVGQGVPLADLIQEGNIGLMRGVEKFDPLKGFRLSTYVVHWIRQQILRALPDQGKAIRVPAYVGEHLVRIKRARLAYESEHGQSPAHDTLARLAGLTLEQLTDMLAIEQTQVVSLDQPTTDASHDGEPMTLGQSVEAAPLTLHTNTQDLRQALTQAGLTPKEIHVLWLRFGLGKLPPMTLQEVGKQFLLTRERIRQIETKAINKLLTQGANTLDLLQPSSRAA